MANKDDYLTTYREFFERFAQTVNPNDQLPVKLASYKLLNVEVIGAIIDWTTQYLTQKQCPPHLFSPIIKIIIEEIRNACKKDPLQYGFNCSDNAYEPLKLMQAVMAKANEVCLRYLDNSMLCSLPTPTTNFYLTSANAVRNKRRTMEDRHVVIHDLNTMFNVQEASPSSYYAVFDGHAGHDAAAYSSAHLHQFLAENKYFISNPEQALIDAFCKTDALFLEKCRVESLGSGTTAVVALLRPKEKSLYIAWVGDSQAIVVNQGRVLQCVNPHKPCREDERERIEKAGGCVILWGTWRVNGQLAVSRAIGDVDYKPHVIAIPDVREVPLDGGEDFLILACDGLWDVVTEDRAAQEVYYMVAENPDNCERISNRLVELAKYQSSTDNISVIVVFLKDPHKIAAEAHRRATRHFSQSTDNMDTELDNANNPFTNSNGTIKNLESDNIHIQKNNDGLLLNFTDFKSDIFVSEKSNGTKRSTSDLNSDDDLGPETNIDSVDDAFSPVEKTNSFGFGFSKALDSSILEQCINDELKNLQEKSDNNNPLKEEFLNKEEMEDSKEDLGDDDGDERAEESSRISPSNEPVHDVSGVEENPADSDSEDEWNYIKGDQTKEETLSSQPETVVETPEDAMSQLNPNAAEFVPISPTRSVPSPTCRSLINEEVISQSPRRAFAVDINVPNQKEFDKEIKSRPSEVGYSNGVEDNDDELDKSITDDQKEKNMLNGKSIDDIPEFHPGSTPAKLPPSEEFHFGPNAAPFTPRPLDQSEAFSTKALYGDDTEQTLNESEYNANKESEDPMSMSFYAEKGESNPFEEDLNKVHELPDNLEEFLQKEDETPLDNDQAAVQITDLDKLSQDDEKELASPLEPDQELDSSKSPEPLLLEDRALSSERVDLLQSDDPKLGVLETKSPVPADEDVELLQHKPPTDSFMPRQLIGMGLESGDLEPFEDYMKSQNANLGDVALPGELVEILQSPDPLQNLLGSTSPEVPQEKVDLPLSKSPVCGLFEQPLEDVKGLVESKSPIPEMECPKPSDEEPIELEKDVELIGENILTQSPIPTNEESTHLEKTVEDVLIQSPIPPDEKPSDLGKAAEPINVDILTHSPVPLDEEAVGEDILTHSPIPPDEDPISEDILIHSPVPPREEEVSKDVLTHSPIPPDEDPISEDITHSPVPPHEEAGSKDILTHSPIPPDEDPISEDITHSPVPPHEDAVSKDILTHSPLPPHEDPISEDILTHSPVPPHEDPISEDILTHSPVTPHEDPISKDILTHSPVPPHEDPISEDILTHSPVPKHEEPSHLEQADQPTGEDILMAEQQESENPVCEFKTRRPSESFDELNVCSKEITSDTFETEFNPKSEVEQINLEIKSPDDLSVSPVPACEYSADPACELADSQEQKPEEDITSSVKDDISSPIEPLSPVKSPEPEVVEKERVSPVESPLPVEQQIPSEISVSEPKETIEEYSSEISCPLASSQSQAIDEVELDVSPNDSVKPEILQQPEGVTEQETTKEPEPINEPQDIEVCSKPVVELPIASEPLACELEASKEPEGDLNPVVAEEREIVNEPEVLKEPEVELPKEPEAVVEPEHQVVLEDVEVCQTSSVVDKPAQEPELIQTQQFVAVESSPLPPTSLSNGFDDLIGRVSEQISIKTENIQREFAEQTVITPSEESKLLDDVPTAPLVETPVEETQPGPVQDLIEPVEVAELKPAPEITVKSPEPAVVVSEETLREVPVVQPLPVAAVIPAEVKKEEAKKDEKKPAASPAKRPIGKVAPSKSSTTAPKVGTATKTAAKPLASPKSATAPKVPPKTGTSRLSVGPTKTAAPPTRLSPKPKTTTSTTPKSTEKKPLTNGDVKAPPQRIIKKKPATEAPATKTTTVRHSLPPTKSTTTKTTAPKPATAPKTTAPRPTVSKTTTSTTAARPKTSLSSKTTTVLSKTSSSTLTATKTTTSGTALSPRTAAASKPRTLTSVSPKPKVPLTKTVTKSADVEKQHKESANKITASRSTTVSRTTTSSATASSKSTTVKKTETLKALPKRPAAATKSSTTTTTAAATKTTVTKKPGELKTVTKTKTTKVEKPKENGIAPASVTEEIKEITIVTNNVMEAETLLKDNSPIDNKLLAECANPLIQATPAD